MAGRTGPVARHGRPRRRAHRVAGGPVTVTVERHLASDDAVAALRDDVLSGLTAPAKWLPPKWFYDERGSELFDEITRLPEYYPTRAERSILAARSNEIAEVTKADTLVE